MELLKRFVAGLGVGAAVVGLAMFALSVAPQSGAESVAQQVPVSSASAPVLPPLPTTASVAPAAPPVAVVPPPNVEPLPPGLPQPTEASKLTFLQQSEVKPAKNEIAKLPLGRSAVRFSGPTGMRVSWFVGEAFHDRDLTAPASFNFVQGETYRLRLTGITKYPNAKFYPTLEVCAQTERVAVFLVHNVIPVTFTDSELATAAEGRLVVKAVYLPGVPGAESATTTDEVSSLRPGMSGDPVSAASSRGTLLAVIRLGNVDLENPHSPALNAPPSTQLPDHSPMVAPTEPR